MIPTLVGYELSHKPELFAHTRRAQYEAMKSGEMPTLANAGAAQLGGAKPTSHWTTNYAQNNETTLSQPAVVSQRPIWSLPRQAYSSKRSFFQTEYSRSLGTYGYNPRDKLNAESTKLSNDQDELNIGTTKTTDHMPGYSGFVPKTDFNAEAVAQS